MTGRDIWNITLLVVFVAAIAYLLWASSGAIAGSLIVICGVALLVGMVFRALARAGRDQDRRTPR